MADALIGLTETTNASNALIANVAQSYLQQNSLLINKVMNYSNLVVPGAKSVALPRSGGFTVAQKTENTAVSAQVITYANDAIAFGEPYCVQFLVEDTAALTSAADLAADAILKASKDMAAAVDTAIVAAMVAGASASNPDHQLVFIDTSTDKIAAGDILAARALLQAQYIEPTECFIGIGPEKENELLAIAAFQSAYIFGQGAPMSSGIFGKVFGMPVIVHTAFADRMVIWHPSAVAYAEQRAMVVESQRDLANVGTRYGLSHYFGVKVLDSGKRLVHVDSTN